MDNYISAEQALECTKIAKARNNYITAKTKEVFPILMKDVMKKISDAAARGIPYTTWTINRHILPYSNTVIEISAQRIKKTLDELKYNINRIDESTYKIYWDIWDNSEKDVYDYTVYILQ